MAVQNSELKMKIGADASDFNKKIQGAKSAIRDFDKTTNSALQGIGDAFGVPVQKVEQLTNAIKGMGIKMTESSNEAVKALGEVIASANKAALAMGSIGIGAVVASFKLLNDEAKTFKNTIEGANLELESQAYLSTYKQFLADATGAGKAVAEASEKGKTWVGTMWQFFKAIKTNEIRNIFGGGVKDSDIITAGIAAAGAAETAKLDQRELNNLALQEIDSRIEISSLQAEINRLKEAAADADLSAYEKSALIAKAAELTRQKYAIQIGIAEKIAEKMRDISSLASDSKEEYEATIAAQQKVNELKAAEAAELTKLTKQQATYAKTIKAERAEVERIAQMRKEMAELNLSVSSKMPTSSVTTAQTGGLAGTKPQDTAKDFKDIGQAIETSIGNATDLASTMIGSLVGDLATGGDAWGNFANAAVSAFGDMAISIGKMAIATGTASLGIKKALELKPELAIAAGAALIALGSAVKSGLGNIASGNYNSGASVATSASYGSSSMGGGYATQTLNVNVTGKLVAQGSTLQAVLDNESKRKNATT